MSDRGLGAKFVAVAVRGAVHVGAKFVARGLRVAVHVGAKFVGVVLGVAAHVGAKFVGVVPFSTAVLLDIKKESRCSFFLTAFLGSVSWGERRWPRDQGEIA